MNYYSRVGTYSPLEITNYKGNKIIVLNALHGQTFSFGLTKAKVIIDNIELLKSYNNDPLAKYKPEFRNGVNLQHKYGTINIQPYWINQIVIREQKIREFIANPVTDNERLKAELDELKKAESQSVVNA